MDNDIKTWLYDILQSIKEIDSFYDNKPKKYADYLTDIKTKRAVERNIEIIGTRNRIAHGYDKISDELIWSIVINSLPKLKEEVDNLLK